MDLICVADLATWASAYQSYSMAAWSGVEWQERFQQTFEGPLGVTTTRFRYDEQLQNGVLGFTPLGVLIGQIGRRMAWRDPSLREFAGYTGIAGGNGTGFQRPWKLDVYSDETRAGVEQGKVTNGWPGEDQWAGWSMVGP